jgi:amino acid transporter
LVKAGFSYILSPELITTTAGECQAPRRNIPKAARRYIYRLIFFYVIGALVIGVLVPYNDPRLLGTSNASASPFVLAIKNASIPVLDHVLNAVILTSAWSSGNSMLYAGSRLLYGMACNGDAPAIFKRCNRLGIPYMAVLASFCLGLLAYLNASSGGAEVFNWLATVTTVNGLLSWSVVLFTYLVCKNPTVNQYRAFCPLDGPNLTDQ